MKANKGYKTLARPFRLIVIIALLAVLCLSLIPTVGTAAPQENRMYVVNSHTISRANLDGTGGVSLGNLNGTLDGPTYIALDLTAGKMYVTNADSDTISRANLDGTGGVSLGNLNGTLNGALGIALELTPPFGTLEILKFHDKNENGARDSYDESLAGWGFNITGPNRYSSSGTTDSSGLLILTNLAPGGYTVAEGYRSPNNPGGAWYCTNGDSRRTVTVPSGGVARLEFGNAYNPKVPASSDTGMYAMIGSFALLIGVLVFCRRNRYQVQR
jgi:DNA-binding beta-propeller fold protein YncE